MTSGLKIVLVLAAVGWGTSAVLWTVNPGGKFRCASADAKSVITHIEHADNWTYDAPRLRTELENFEYLSFWYSNEYTLGVARNEPAFPFDAEFSDSCKWAIAQALDPIRDKYIEIRQEGVGR
jgi:hypothetical protein